MSSHACTLDSLMPLGRSLIGDWHLMDLIAKTPKITYHPASYNRDIPLIDQLQPVLIKNKMKLESTMEKKIV